MKIAFDVAAVYARECVQALGWLIARARKGDIEGLVVIWWPRGSGGDATRASWLYAGRVARYKNDAHVGAARLMRSLTDPPPRE